MEWRARQTIRVQIIATGCRRAGSRADFADFVEYVERHHVVEVERLLKAGADVNAKDAKG